MELLSKARNILGPIGDESKAAIREYLTNPTKERWDNIRTIVIRWDGGTNTVWQALCRMDSKYRDRLLVPDGMAVARALKKVLDDQP